ncbi:acetyltransferase (GNAT) family protein [Stella humosa]|uniref:Acetyltransferase (GNAT) family protein n=1 Tax=Stella humosa TaxID=94 RepID=A0A3N1KW01_9PROT|nr:GNAT family N-acetyltransferase [Stella humosa]ROP83592.1 acetyltransferase (GNAT) family protein [Stella humosa]BBK33136.1 N-acetyltransferase [Stella humosa]
MTLSPSPLRALVVDDLEAAHDLSRAVGWAHRLDDWRFVHGLGHGFAADDAGRLVGTGMYWPFGQGFATLGLVIVDPARQGAGIGRRLMTGLLEAIGPRTTLLIATDAGAPLYEKLGFATIGGIVQHQGQDCRVPDQAMPAGWRIRPAAMADLAALAALDTQATGLARPHVLQALLTVAEGAVLERDGQPVGFAVCRLFGRGRVVGPIVAPDEAGARALIAHWIAACPGQFMRVDIPDTVGLGPWLEAHGLARIAPGIAMARGPAPVQTGDARLFGLINQALG